MQYVIVGSIVLLAGLIKLTVLNVRLRLSECVTQWIRPSVRYSNSLHCTPLPPETYIRQRQYAHVAAINDWTTMVNHYKEWEVVSYEFIKDDMNYKVVVVKWSQYKQKGTTVEARTHTVRLPYKPNVGQIIQCPNLV